MVMGADSCLFECANPNQQLSRPMTSTSPGAAVDDLGKRLHAALLSSRPTGSFRPTPPPRLLHHILGRALDIVQQRAKPGFQEALLPKARYRHCRASLQRARSRAAV